MSRSTEERDDIRYDSDFSRIEELIEGNSFSREEISHLLEILNSRVDNNEREKQKSSIRAEGDAPHVLWTHAIRRTPPQERHQDIEGTMIGTFKKSDVSLGVGSSPIDIARAYMASRTTEGGLDHDNLISNESALQSNEFARKQILPSPFPKPSTYWPGAMVHNSHGYATPQSQKGRHRLHDFSRTPYSRTALQKSTTKLRAENGSPYVSNPYVSTPFQLSQKTSLYDQVKSRGNNVDGYGSVGPIRRIRNKFASEVRPRGYIFPSLSTDTSSTKVTPKKFGGFLPSTEKNLEPGESSGTVKPWSGDNVPSPSDQGVSDPDLSSIQTVRTILESLDRTRPTPKEKEAELRRATSWRTSSIEASDTIHKENVNSVHIGDLASRKNADAAGENISEEISTSRNSKFLVHYKGTNEVKDSISGNATAANAVSTGFNNLSRENLLPSFGHMGSSGPAVNNLSKSTFVTTNHGQNQTNMHFPHPQSRDEYNSKMATAQTGSELPKDNAMKPSLPSISIKKPVFRAVPSDNGPGFTFPVSASSGVLSELPTPSITPPSSASFLSQSAADTPSELPSYSFGTNRSTQPLVFSFPSMGSDPANDHNTDLKFNFGSDKKMKRLSFNFSTHRHSILMP